MSIPIKSSSEIKLMRKAGKIVADCLIALKSKIKAGMTTKDIDYFVDWFLLERGALAAQKGYRGYMYAACTSINEVACHGVPSATQKLVEGDIITVDIVADVRGYKADSAWTYIVGKGSDETEKLVDAARKTLRAGLKYAKPGVDVADIGEAIESEATRLGYSVVTSFSGHGIGKGLHEPPQILNYKHQKNGIILSEGMVITIEPIVVAGNPEMYISTEDGWSVISKDNHLSAQFEHTILITKKGHEILTSQKRQSSKIGKSAKALKTSKVEKNEKVAKIAKSTKVDKGNQKSK